MKTGLNAQRGITLSGMIMAAVVVVLLAIAAMKVVPYYIQNQTIKSEFEEILGTPGLKGASDHDLQTAFFKRASVSNINAINEHDIDISRDGGVVTLSASYVVKVPLAGNATLLLEFNPSVSK